MHTPKGKWQRLSSKIVHRNPYYVVREDAVIRPDGVETVYNVVELRGAVIVVAMDAEQRIQLIGLERYPIGKYSIELPGGGTDGEDPLVAAKRELREESGLTARSWKYLGMTHPANGVISEENHVFLATDLTLTDDNQQAEEGITSLQKVTLKEAFALVHDGQITDQQTITALTMSALETGLL